MTEEPAPSTLYLVGTPIGNAGDLSPRALRILGAVDLVAAEDTRHTRGLLSRFGLDRPMISYHDHNKDARTPELIGRLRGGASVAVVSDAGSPGISDPAFTLVRAAVEEEIPVVPIPGPSSLLCALEVSGLPTDRFAFEGFLPRRPGRRRARIAELRDDPRTLIFFESPHRLAAALRDLLEGLGDRRASVSRELTKKFEETRRGPISELLAWAEERPRGEFVLVVAGSPGARDGRRRAGAADDHGDDGDENEEDGAGEEEPWTTRS
jgi:16S rRNA (cytidine1402-2'-O)-methyltransferase